MSLRTAARISRNALADTETSAGNYTGTSAVTGTEAGLANGRSEAKKIRVTATGTTVENEIRVYRRNNTGPVYTYLFSLWIPAKTVVWPTPPYVSPWFPMVEPLPGTTHALAFNKEKNATNLIIEYVVEDY